MGGEGERVRTYERKRELAIIIRETSKNSNGMSDEVPRHKTLAEKLVLDHREGFVRQEGTEQSEGRGVPI